MLKILGSILFLLSLNAQAELDLLANELKAWKTHKFVGSSKYTNVGQGVIKALSKGAASGLIYEKRIDLDKTPILSWKWKVTKQLMPANEKSKQGDDFSARVYVVSGSKLLFWKTISLNYVWADKAKINSSWASPYTNNSRMIAKSNSRQKGSWQSIRVNLKRDFKRYFAKDIRYIDAIAIMTDTDNTAQEAEAYYSSLKLLSK